MSSSTLSELPRIYLHALGGIKVREARRGLACDLITPKPQDLVLATLAESLAAMCLRYGRSDRMARVGRRAIHAFQSRVPVMAASCRKADGGGPWSRRRRIAAAHASGSSAEVSTSRS